MEFTFQTAILLPVGLGLLGFVEPCTVGAHLVYLRSQSGLPYRNRVNSLLSFISARSIVAGLFGALLSLAGGALVGLQTTLWLAFGLLYVAIGTAFLINRSRFVKKRVNLAPEAWKQAQNPTLLGLAFGLNIPACAAPILFGLLGLAASFGTVAAGFFMMFLFGLSLSLPLALFVAFPGFTSSLEAFGERMRGRRWVFGLVFLVLGAWSIWFGLFVDPAKWATL